MQGVLPVFFLICIVSGFGYAYYHFHLSYHFNAANSASAAFGADPVSATDLHSDYNATSSLDKARILIVPGHEPDYGGAQFGSVYERNLVVEIGQDLEQYLQTNSNYQVYITRDTQAWNPIFSDYFTNDWNAIAAWEKTAAQNAPSLASLGASGAPPVEHITDPTNVALRLYGITKWANENNIDLMIHLHLNDYPGHSATVAGKYSGLVIYIPAQQYTNSSTTKAIADAVFKRLSLYNPIDNLPIESSGVIDDPELIAVGANNTADAASMLIEYDYIYEPQFVNPKVRSLALKDLAYQTYLGLQDFFTKNNAVAVTSSYHPSSLYTWSTPVTGTNSNPEDIYALQTALLMDGDYPPAGKTKNDCPHSGTFGACTKAALKAFQNKNGIAGESAGGPKTFSLLSRIYSGN
jgi:N-acetylmuramoyl-L-alanine amidase